MGVTAGTLKIIQNTGMFSAEVIGGEAKASGIVVQEYRYSADPSNIIGNSRTIRAHPDGAGPAAQGIFGYIGNPINNSGFIDVEANGISTKATGFSAEADMLTDLTRVISDGIDRRLVVARAERMSGAVAVNGTIVVPTADTPIGGATSAVFWAFALAQGRDQKADVARAFMSQLLNLPRVRRLLSSEHFSVDGTLVDAWASMKSFQPRDGSGEPPSPGRNGERNFRKEKRSDATHVSTTDPDAQLFRKGDGQSSRLCFMGHALMENRNGLIVDCQLTRATGTAEREAALAMIERSRKARSRTVRGARVTLGADRGFDAEDFVLSLKERNVTPHIAINGAVSKTGKARKTAVDGRTTRHKGYAISQRCRKRIEESFGWAKTIGGAARLKVRGLARANAVFTLQMIAYNLVRIPKLLAAAA